jgi:hypothetical protein
MDCHVAFAPRNDLICLHEMGSLIPLTNRYDLFPAFKTDQSFDIYFEPSAGSASGPILSSS